MSQREDLLQKVAELRQTFLVFGNTGVGKSSFLKRITGDPNIQIRKGNNSDTQECFSYQKDGNTYIDTPGINDTKRSRYDILFSIARYLHLNKIQPEEIFIIYLTNSPLQEHLNLIQEITAAIYLYQLFKEDLKLVEVESFVLKIQKSCFLLEINKQNQTQNQSSQKWNKIVEQRKIARNYLQHFHSFHIVVRTHFDTEKKRKFQSVDEKKMKFLREQIWSDKLTSQFQAYNDYIQCQQEHLFQKIINIIEIERENKDLPPGMSQLFVLLLGKSQVGKSAVVEQLTGYKGLQGDGKHSETSLCQMYSIRDSSRIYRIIDTPGFEGTETNQGPFQNFKIIGDYLKRNEIRRIKLLFVRKESSVRDNIDQTLKKFELFITHIFDQDSSLIDIGYLEELLRIEQNNINNQDLIFQGNLFQKFKEKLLQIHLVDSEEDDNYQSEDDEEEDQMMNDNHEDQGQEENVEIQENTLIQAFKYRTSYSINDGHSILHEYVNEEDNQRQNQNLLMKLSMMKEICIEDKIIYSVQKISKIKLIENQQQYKEYYQAIKQLYSEYFILVRQSQSSTLDYPTLQSQERKFQILEQLENTIYAVDQRISDSNEIKEFIEGENFIQEEITRNGNAPMDGNNNNQLDGETLRQICNRIHKHIIKISQQPILFELQESPKDIFISMKQQFYSKYAYQLREFITDQNKEHSKKILEDLATIAVIQQISLERYLYIQNIEQLSDRNVVEILDHIDILVSGINALIGTGAQIYKYVSYLGDFAERTIMAYQVVRIVNITTMSVCAFLAAVNIGIDLYSFKQGNISNKQFNLNLFINTIGTILSISAMLTPVGWAIGGAAGLITLAGYGLSSMIFTSSTTLDQTSALFFKSIIDDKRSNQSLQYFQKARLLNSVFKIQCYSQLDKKEGYLMLRQLEKKNYKVSQKQKQILLELYNVKSKDYKLQNQISEYISQNYISNKLSIPFIQNDEECRLGYLERIKFQLQDLSSLINNFYNRYPYQISFVNQINLYFKSKEIVISMQNDFEKQINQENNSPFEWQFKHWQLMIEYNEFIKQFSYINRAYLCGQLQQIPQLENQDIKSYLKNLIIFLNQNQPIIYKFYQQFDSKFNLETFMKLYEDLSDLIQQQIDDYKQSKNDDNLINDNLISSLKIKGLLQDYLKAIAHFKFIRLSHLSSQIQSIFKEQLLEENIDYLLSIQQYLKEDEELIKTLNEQYQKINLKLISNSQKEYLKLVESKIKIEKSKQNKNKIIWMPEEQSIIHSYINQVSELKKIEEETIKKQLENKYNLNSMTNLQTSDLKLIQKQMLSSQEYIYSFYSSYDTDMIKNIQHYQKMFKTIIEKKIEKENKNKKPVEQKGQINTKVIWSSFEDNIISNYAMSVSQLKEQIRQKNFPYKLQKEFGDGSLRKQDRFPILFYTYCNLMEEKNKCLLNEETISNIEKDPINNKYKIKQENSFNDSFFNFKENELCDMLNLLSSSEMYISNRYFQKIKGANEYNFTYISKDEQLDCKPENSIDLHDEAKKAKTYEIFKLEVQKLTSSSKEDSQLAFWNQDIEQRLYQFYQSIKNLEKTFNKV